MEPSAWDKIDKVLRALENPTAHIYAVGGAVRDAFLDSGITPHDIDLTSLLTPEEFKKLCKDKNYKTIDVGIEHGTVTAIINGVPYEHTTFREDVTTDGRKAQVKFSTSLEKDAQRRDFTLNAVYTDLKSGIMLPENHLEDLKNKQIVSCGDPYERFKEDYLRIMRLFRFKLKYEPKGFNVDTQTYRAACLMAIDVKKFVSKERILEELYKAYLAVGPKVFISELKKDELGKEISKRILGVDFSKKPILWYPANFKSFLIQICYLNPDLVHELPLTRDDLKAWSLLTDFLSPYWEEPWKRKNSFTTEIADKYFFGSPFYLTILKGEEEVEKIKLNWPKHLTGKEIGIWQKNQFKKRMSL